MLYGWHIYVLIINKSGEPVFVKQLKGYLLNLSRLDRVYVGEQCFYVFLTAVVQKAFAKVKSKVLPVVACNANLSFKLFLRC